ncbi:MAG: AAA family ATPase [Proteobacteria bacterium]|nr:AAA family ATPase [Pseudomonadota bacterium]
MCNKTFSALADISMDIEQRLKSALVSGNENNEKKLNDLTQSQAADLIGISRQRIFTLEKEGRLPPPRLRESGAVDVKVYNLKEIENLRKVFGLMPPKFNPDGLASILTLSNLKGGVGKSTVSVHAAQYFALQGYKVLFIDLDPQATATSAFGYIPLKDLSVEDTIFNAITKSPEEIEGVIRKTYWHNLDLIPSHLKLQSVDALIYRGANGDLSSPALRVKNALEVVRDMYDIIVIDTPPSVSSLAIGAAVAADYLVIPIVANMPDIQATSQYFQTMSEMMDLYAEEIGDDLVATKLKKNILINRFNGNSGEQRHNLAMLRRHFNGVVLESTIADTVEMERAASDMQTIYEIEPRGSREAYRRAVDMLNKANQEMLNNLIGAAALRT